MEEAIPPTRTVGGTGLIEAMLQERAVWTGPAGDESGPGGEQANCKGETRCSWRNLATGSLAVLFCLLLSACDDRLFELSREMRELQQALTDMTAAESVSIKIIDDRTMVIDLANLPANDSPADVRRALARRVTAQALTTYSYRARLETVTVNFMAHRRKYLFFNVSRVVDTFVFDVRGGGIRPAAGGGEDSP